MSSLASSGIARHDAPRPFRSTPRETETPAYGKSRGLSAQRERELADLIAQGDLAARDELVLGNLAIARHRAYRLFFIAPHSHTIDDLAQEGVRGLLVAAAKYRPADHGTRFSSYAVWWVDQRIRRAIQDTGEMIRMPAHIHDRRQAAERRARRTQVERVEVALEGDNHLERMIDNEQRERLRRAIARLKRGDRELLHWYATDYGTPGPKPDPNNVRRNRAHAAKTLLARLREELNQEGTDRV
jgi:RNA polymerase sigma factor (sigma-70 family)